MSAALQLKNRHTGEILNLRRVRERDGTVVLAIDGSLPPRSQGPPPHIHRVQTEKGTVKAGTLAARVGGETITRCAGESGEFPAGVVHAWWNGGEDLLEFSGRAIPAADLDRFLQAVFAVVNASPAGRPSLFHLAHVLWRHRRTQVMAVPPPAMQAMIFPPVIALGHLLGKYRGSDWPGAPAKCTGAPGP